MKAAAVTVVMVGAVLCLAPGCRQDPAATAATSVPARSGELQFLGQPSVNELAEMRSDGVDIVINARPDAEMDWDEAAAAAALGLEYYAVPIERGGSGFERASIEHISVIVDANPDQDIVLHCSSGNRVAAWYAIYLVQQQGLSLEEALQRARAKGLTGAAPRVGVYLAEQ